MTDVKTIGENGTLDDVLRDASAEIRAIVLAARELLANVMPGITEVPWGQQKIAGYGVGPKKMSEQFCYIAPFKKHVNLGFYYGADLTDPDGLLEGSGRALRHIKLRVLEDLENPAIRALVQQASRYLPKLKSK